MKLLIALTAGVVALAGLAAPAAAAPQRERVVVRERTVVQHRNYGRPRPQRVCTVRYRRGERIRTCRTIYRRYR